MGTSPEPARAPIAPGPMPEPAPGLAPVSAPDTDPAMLEKMARFASGLRRADVPGRAWAQAKKALLDFAGVALAGTQTPTARQLASVLRLLGSSSDCTLIGAGVRHTAFGAALFNGSCAHHHELDDGHVLAHTHPGVTTIPAALALAERHGASGEHLLLGIIAGYEINIRLGDAITPSAMYKRAYHVPALVGAFGAAAAGARVLGLDHETAVRALGCACLTPAAAMETFRVGATVKDLYGGWPAATGLLAVDLATNGFAGARTLLEGKMGVLRGITDEVNTARITGGFGERWDILDIYFKAYAACSQSHTTIDAALEVRRQVPHLTPDQVERIVVRTHAPAHELQDPRPTTPQAAKFSLPFCLGLALARGAVDLDGFTDAWLANPTVLGYAAKVSIVLDPELDQLHRRNEAVRPSSVTITLASGRSVNGYREVARGWPENPMTEEEFGAKFDGLAGLVRPAAEVREICRTIMGIDQEPSVLPLLRLLAG